MISSIVASWQIGTLTAGEVSSLLFAAIVRDPNPYFVGDAFDAMPSALRVDVAARLLSYIGADARSLIVVGSNCASPGCVQPPRDYEAEQRAIRAIEEWAA